MTEITPKPSTPTALLTELTDLGKKVPNATKAKATFEPTDDDNAAAAVAAIKEQMMTAMQVMAKLSSSTPADEKKGSLSGSSTKPKKPKPSSVADAKDEASEKVKSAKALIAVDVPETWFGSEQWNRMDARVRQQYSDYAFEVLNGLPHAKFLVDIVNGTRVSEDRNWLARVWANFCGGGDRALRHKMMTRFLAELAALQPIKMHEKQKKMLEAIEQLDVSRVLAKLKIDELETAADTATDKIAMMEHELKNEKQTNINFQTTFGQVKEQFEAALQIISKLTSEKTAATRLQTDTKREVDTLSETVTAQNNDLKMLRSCVTKLTDDLDEMKTLVVKQQSQINTLLGALAQKTMECDQKERANRELTATVVEKENEISRLKKEIDELKTSNTNDDFDLVASPGTKK